MDVRSPDPSNICTQKTALGQRSHQAGACEHAQLLKAWLPKVAMASDDGLDIWIAPSMAFRCMPDRDTCNATSTDPQTGDVDRPGRRQTDDGGRARRGLTSFLEQASRAWNEILQNYRAVPYAISAAPRSATPSPIGIRAQAARAPIKNRRPNSRGTPAHADEGNIRDWSDRRQNSLTAQDQSRAAYPHRAFPQDDFRGRIAARPGTDASKTAAPTSDRRLEGRQPNSRLVPPSSCPQLVTRAATQPL